MSKITTAAELDALPVGSVVMYVLPSEPDAPSVACRAVRGWQFLGDDPERRYLSQSLAPTGRPLRVLYRPDAPALSDAALVEEAARRGMTVTGIAEAARLRVGATEAGIASAACAAAAQYADERDALRSGIEALADECETAGDDTWTRCRVAAARLRALLSADDEPEVSA